MHMCKVVQKTIWAQFEPIPILPSTSLVSSHPSISLVTFCLLYLLQIVLLWVVYKYGEKEGEEEEEEEESQKTKV